MKNLIKRILISSYYLFNKKDNELIIISSYKNEKFSFYSRVFFEYLISEKSEFKVLFVISDHSAREKLINKYGDYFISFDSFSDLQKIYSAKFWIVSTKSICMLPMSIFNREIINVWHGFPLKSIGLKDKYQSILKKVLYKYYYSLSNKKIVAQSEKVAPIYSESFGVDKSNILVLGSLIGEMFGRSLDTDVNNYVDKLTSGYKNILYAPTYRDGGATKYFPFKDFDYENLCTFLERKNIRLFIRPHHLDHGFKDYINNKNVFLLFADQVPEINFYLHKFDVLLTDYSSIIFDYQLTNGAIGLIPYDLDAYIKDRGMNFEYQDCVVGKRLNSYSDLLDLLRLVSSSEGDYKNNQVETINDYVSLSASKESCTKLLQYIRSKK